MVDSLQIRNILDIYFQTSVGAKIEISDLGVVSVVGNVTMTTKARMLPCRFGVIQGNFTCVQQGLLSLDGAPQKVSGVFSCHHNKLTNLVGGPSSVGETYNCHGQELESLEGLPQTPIRRLFLTYTPKLPLLRTLVAQEIWLDPSLTDLASLEDRNTVETILNDPRWVGQGKMGLFDCQKELEDAGFEENARW